VLLFLIWPVICNRSSHQVKKKLVHGQADSFPDVEISVLIHLHILPGAVASCHFGVNQGELLPVFEFGGPTDFFSGLVDIHPPACPLKGPGKK
jgi:hypothetical protein